VTFHSFDDVVVVGFLEAATPIRSEEIALRRALLLELSNPVAQSPHAQLKLPSKLLFGDRPRVRRLATVEGAHEHFHEGHRLLIRRCSVRVGLRRDVGHFAVRFSSLSLLDIVSPRRSRTSLGTKICFFEVNTADIRAELVSTAQPSYGFRTPGLPPEAADMSGPSSRLSKERRQISVHVIEGKLNQRSTCRAGSVGPADFGAGFDQSRIVCVGAEGEDRASSSWAQGHLNPGIK
jgi:hypothetical protein